MKTKCGTDDIPCFKNPPMLKTKYWFTELNPNRSEMKGFSDTVQTQITDIRNTLFNKHRLNCIFKKQYFGILEERLKVLFNCKFERIE